MFDYISENIKNAINKLEITNTLLATKMNNSFKENGFSETKITAVKLGALQKGEPKNIFLHELFGLAGKLDCFGYDFVNETIRNLGNFEVKLFSFNNGLEYNQHILELEKGGRIGIFPSFPSYPYRPISSFNKQAIFENDSPEMIQQKIRINDLIEQNIKINNQRLENLKSTKNTNQIQSFEYYTIDSFVKFLFNPFETTLSTEQKINSLERMKDVFKTTSSHCFFYTSTDFYQRQYASMEILKLNNLVYLNLPIRSAILVIRNDKFYNELNHFFSTIKQQTCFRTTLHNEEVVELLDAGLKYLEKSKHPFCTFNDFVTFRDQLRSNNLQELLKLAFPHL